MRRYIISYDLYQPERNYADLSREIKRFAQNWERPLSHLWVVESPLGARAIRDALHPHLEDGDKLYVRNVGNDVAGLDVVLEPKRSDIAVSDWTPTASTSLLASVLSGPLRRRSPLLMAATAENCL